MNFDELRSIVRLSRQKSERILVYVTLVLCLVIVGQTVLAVIEKHSISGSVEESMAFLQVQDDKAKEYLEAYKKETEKLKEKGMFCIEKKPPPPPQVTGILGDSVLMSDKWCKIGDEHAGAKVLKIEPTEITILWQEKEMKLAPLLASHSGGSDQVPDKKVTKKESAQPSGHELQAQKTAPTVETAPQDDPLAWLGMEMSAEVRDFLNQLFEVMPANRVEEAKQEWANLTQEEKEQRMNEVQSMVDSGQAGTVLEQMKAAQ